MIKAVFTLSAPVSIGERHFYPHKCEAAFDEKEFRQLEEYKRKGIAKIVSFDAPKEVERESFDKKPKGKSKLST